MSATRVLSGLVLTAGLATRLFAQTAQTAPPAARNPLAGLPDLVAALKASPGCLGVETARTTTGKNVLFAWFENKEAVRTWYYSAVHQGVVRMATGRPESQKPPEPMVGVPENVGPIMAIASITPSDTGGVKGFHLPISQISIELYTPVTGGIFIGSRFAPEGLKVPGIKDYTPPKE